MKKIVIYAALSFSLFSCHSRVPYSADMKRVYFECRRKGWDSSLIRSGAYNRDWFPEWEKEWRSIPHAVKIDSVKSVKPGVYSVWYVQDSMHWDLRAITKKQIDSLNSIK